MRFSQNQVVSINVDNVAADGLSRIKCQSKIFMFCVECQILYVYCTVIDRIWTGVIDDFTTKVTL